MPVPLSALVLSNGYYFVQPCTLLLRRRLQALQKYIALSCGLVLPIGGTLAHLKVDSLCHSEHISQFAPYIVFSQRMQSHYTAHPTAVVDEGCTIGEGTKIWHFSHIMPNCTIGEHCNIGQNVVISPQVVLGNNVKIQNNVSLYTGVTCEDDVFLGPSCVFTNVTNPRSAINRRDQYAKTNVGKGASVGANATIVCGHDIGKYAFIGAGAVVTKNVPNYSLVVGNPAKQLGWISEYGHRLSFDAQGEAVCPESKDVYILTNGNVSKK